MESDNIKLETDFSNLSNANCIVFDGWINLCKLENLLLAILLIQIMANILNAHSDNKKLNMETCVWETGNEETVSIRNFCLHS